VPAWVAQQIAVRGFYARGDTWRPMLLGTGVALAALPLYWAAGRRFGVDGLAGAGVVAMSANALATLSYARWRHGGPALGPVAASALRSAVIATAAGWAGAKATAHRPGLAGALVDLGLGGAAFAAVAGVGVVLAGDPALRAGFARFGRGLRRRAGALRSGAR
jgi:peptidoglycan biosynthesis protein MviN/MurJ (putative lipid II flippase)